MHALQCLMWLFSLGSSPYSLPRDIPSGNYTLTVSALVRGEVVSSSEVEFEVKGAPVVMVTVDVKECGAVLQVVGNNTDLACICYLDNKEEGQNCELKLLISVFLLLRTRCCMDVYV